MRPLDEDPNAESTGLPGVRRWRGVYLLVLAVLAIWVVALTLLPRLFA